MSQITYTSVKPLKTSSFGLWLPMLFMLANGGLLAIMIFLALAYQLVYLNQINPGVQVAGLNVGGMTQAQVMATIGQRAPDYLARRVTVAYGSETWTFTGQELGMQMDVAKTANAAYAVGRKGHLIADMLTHLSLLGTSRNIEPVILYDPGPTNQVLQDLADKINQAPQDAQLIIHPDAQIEVIEPQRGRRMNVEATQPFIEAALFENNGQVVNPVVQQILPTITDVEAARQQAENLIGQPLIFRFQAETETTEWRLEREELVGMIDMTETVNAADKTEFSITPNREKFMPYIEQMAAAIKREPIDARLEFNPEPTGCAARKSGGAQPGC